MAKGGASQEAALLQGLIALCLVSALILGLLATTSYLLS